MNERHKKVFSIALILCMAVTLLPTAAFAADTPAQLIGDDGTIYYGVESEYFQSSTALFIKDMLAAKSSEYLRGQSAATLWQQLAYRIQQVKGYQTQDGKFKDDFTAVLKWGTGYYQNTTTDPISAHLGAASGNEYNIEASGLQHASSVSNAGWQIENAIFSAYQSSGGGRKDQYHSNPSNAAVVGNGVLKDDTDPDTVYWMLAGAYKTTGSNKIGHYQALGIVFSDFKISTILPEDNGSFYQTFTEDGTPSSRTYASSVNNMTSEAISAQQEITNTTSVTESSEINGSKSYSFEESIKIGAEKTFGLVKGSLEVGFTASETVEKGWSKSESNSQDFSTTHTVGVTLPPYTNVMMTQNESQVTETTTYNCPVALSFTVTIVEYALDPSDNDAAAFTNILATFGGNARKDLLKRGVVEASLTDPNGINWTAVRATEDTANVIDLATKTMPMSTSGAKYTVVVNTVNSRVSALAPVLALDRIKTVGGVYEYKLAEGDFLFVDNIELSGLNAKGSTYYGFDADNGEWRLVDKYGNEVYDSSVAVLEKNSLTGATKLKATGEGTINLMYFIDEDVYSTAEAPDTYTRNADIKSAAIEINVTGTRFSGTVEVAGTLSGYVGDPAINLDESTLRAIVTDSEDIIISRPVVWEARDQTVNSGISIVDNKLSFAKSGTYLIRANCGGVVSAWTQVTAKPAREIDSILITDPFEPSILTADVKGGTAEIELSQLVVSPKDQYGDWWVNDFTGEWKCDAGELAQVNAETLTVSAVGEYEIYYKSGDISSNKLTVTVTDSTEVKEQPELDTSSIDTAVAAANAAKSAITVSDSAASSVASGTKFVTTAEMAALNDAIAAAQAAKATSATTEEAQAAASALDLARATFVAAIKTGTYSPGGGGNTGGGSLPAPGSVVIAETKDGTVTVSSRSPENGASVTVTATPDEGYVLESLVITEAGGSIISSTKNADGTFTFTFTSGTVTVKAVFATELDDGKTPLGPLPFTDVLSTDWYYDAVVYAVEKGLFNGVTETQYKPNMDMTRGMLITVLWRLEGEPAAESAAFPDVAQGSYCESAVAWAAKNGIASGYEDGRFGPDDVVTREQFATILYNYIKYKGGGFEGTWAFPLDFADADKVSDWAYEALCYCTMHGVITGKPGNLLDPQGSATRAEAATMLHRFLELDS